VAVLARVRPELSARELGRGLTVVVDVGVIGDDAGLRTWDELLDDRFGSGLIQASRELAQGARGIDAHRLGPRYRGRPAIAAACQRLDEQRQVPLELIERRLRPVDAGYREAKALG
jgi:hypothetical protein